MANPREIKNRLRGIRKTQQITRAMKMVAAVKLRRAQTALAHSRPYAERIRALAADFLAQIDPLTATNGLFPERQLAQARPPRRENILVIVVASDRGLCGSMNVNIFRQVLQVLNDLNAPAPQKQKPEVQLLLIGRKAKDFFRTQQSLQAENLPYRIRATVNFSGIDAAQLGSQCCELYRQGEFDRIELMYNESSSALQHRPVRTVLFPLDTPRMRPDAVQPRGNIIFEPAWTAMRDDIISGFVVSEARKILMEAEVAEHAARMLMMDLATKNADDLISSTQLIMNKLRQLSITSELADITAGAEALA